MSKHVITGVRIAFEGGVDAAPFAGDVEVAVGDPTRPGPLLVEEEDGLAKISMLDADGVSLAQSEGGAPRCRDGLT